MHRGQSRALLLRQCSRVQSYTPALCLAQNTTLPHAASAVCNQNVLWRCIAGNLAPCFCGGKRAAPILSRCSVVAAQSVHLVPSKPRAKTDPALCLAQNTTLPCTAFTVRIKPLLRSSINMICLEKFAGCVIFILSECFLQSKNTKRE